MTAAVRGVIRQLEAATDPPSDAACLAAFAATGDAEAFASLVARHGPMVYGACRRVLGDAHEAEDAFQAVFLVLARKAEAVRPAGAVGGWLYGVAIRTANKAKVAAGRRRRREMIAAAQAARAYPPADSADHAEVASVLDYELAKLPQALRAAIVLCDLHDKTRAEAAIELRCPEGTIAARLHRGRKKLAEALTRRGLALPAAGLAAVLTPAAVPAAGTKAVLSFAAGAAASPIVSALAREVIRSMATITNSIAVAVVALVAGGVLAAGGLWPSVPGGQGQASAASPDQKPPAPPATAETKPDSAADRAPGYVERVQFSPDGTQYLVVTAGKVVVHDSGSRRVLWDTQGEAASFLNDGKSVLVMGEKSVSRHEAKTGQETKSYPRPKTNWGWHKVAFAPDGKRYAAHFGFNDRIYDTETGFEPVRLEKQFEPGGYLSGGAGCDLFFSPDGKNVFAIGVLVDEGILGAAAWEVESGSRIETFKLNVVDAPQCAAYAPNGVAFAVGYQDRVELRPIPKGEIRKLSVLGRATATAIALSPDGKLMAVGVRRPIHNLADKEPATEPVGKIIKRLRDEVVEINIGANANVSPGQRLMVLPAEYPKKGPQSRMRKFRVPNDKGEFETVQRFSSKGSLAVTEVLGEKSFRCRIIDEQEPVREALAVGDLVYFVEPKQSLKTEVQVLDVATGKELQRFDGFEGGAATTELPVTSLSFSPHGNRLLAGTGVLPMETQPAGEPKRKSGEVKLFTIGQGEKGEKPVSTNWKEAGRVEGITDYVDSIAFSPEGKVVATGSPVGVRSSPVRVWDAQTWKSLWMSGRAPTGYTAVAFSPDGKLLAATRDQETDFYEVMSTKLLRLKQPFPGGKAVAWSPDGKWLAYSDGRITGIRALDANKGEASDTAEVPASDKYPASVAWSPDSLYLVHAYPTPGGTGLVCMMGVTPETKPMNLSGHKGQVTAVSWSKDGRFIASGDDDGKVIVWDGKTFKELRRVDLGGRSGKSTIFDLAFSPDCRTLAAALQFDEGKNVNRVVLLDPTSGERTQNDLQHFWDSPPMTVAFSPDGKTLLVGCGSRIPKLRDLPVEERKGGVFIFTQDADQPKAPAGAVSPAPASAAPTWREKTVLKDVADSIVSVAYDPKGKTFAAGYFRGDVVNWNASDLTNFRRLNYSEGRFLPAAVVYSPDGRIFAQTCPGGSLLIDTTTWKSVFNKQVADGELAEIVKGQASPTALAFAPTEEVDGLKLNRLAMTDGHSVIAAIWLDGGPPSTAKFGPMAGAPKIDGQAPAGVAYSPDGKRLVFIPNYKMWPDGQGEQKGQPPIWIAQVWGGGSGAPMVILKHGLSMVTAVAWSADGKYITSGDIAGEVALWDGKTFKEVRRVHLARAGEECTINALAFTHDGKSLAVACSFEKGKEANRVVFVDLLTGLRGEELHGFTSAPLSLAFSPDDQMLIVGCGCRLVNAKKPIPEDQRHEGCVRVFSRVVVKP